jgi:membrane protease subunit HflK
MGWNDPPGGNRPNDPWGGRGRGEGPPDLDEIVRKLQQGLGGIFGRKPPGVAGAPGTPLLLVILIAALVIWILWGFYTIDEQERGIVLRFGRYVATLQPGLNFRAPPPIEEVIKINIGQVNTITHKASMLTQDENIVDVEVAVQWRVRDPTQYLFNVTNPAATLRQVVESAVREVIGRSKLDFVLTEGRGEIDTRQKDLIQQTLDQYQAGILIVGVNMQPAKPPEPVKESFDDAIKAREDEQRLVNEAEAYRNEILPKARGQAARMREEANAYKARVVARAEGEASRFEQLLAEYERAPAVTRQRLYLDTIEVVLAGTGKILMGAGGASNLLYLPIERLLEQSGRGAGQQGAGSPAQRQEHTPLLPGSRDTSSRAREIR